jgi:phosphatidylglycerophosphate synthase
MIANAVTASRLVLAVPLYLLLTAHGDAAAWAAFGVMVLAGLTDVVDGRIARALNQVSKLGAMLDLISDRVLTATLAVGLIASGRLTGLWAGAALILLARDLAVASFGEATQGRAKFPVTPLERVKITLQFAGLGLLVAPELVGGQHAIGAWALAASAALALITLLGYAQRANAALD